MATPKQKQQLIDKYNASFLNESIGIVESDYKRWFDKIVLETTKQGTNKRGIRKIVRETPIKEDKFIAQSYNTLTLSGITNVIENQRLDKQDRDKFGAAMILLSLYGMNKPKLVAKKVQLVTNAILTNSNVGLTDRDMKVKIELKKYYKANNESLQKLIKNSKKRVKEIHKRVKSNVSKVIIKNLDKEIRERVIDETGKKVPKTAGQIKKSMRDKFGKQIEYRVNRILDTELGSLQEEAKFVQHSLLGYNFKKWNNTKDVGASLSHSIEDKEKAIPIDKKFYLKGIKGDRNPGAWANYPKDPNLPPGQRINCKCFLTYLKR